MQGLWPREDLGFCPEGGRCLVCAELRRDETAVWRPDNSGAEATEEGLPGR